MYLLDTDICIYIIKKKPLSVLNVMKKKSRQGISVSSLSVAELQNGIEKSSRVDKNRVVLIEFLSLFSIINFDDRDAVEFGRIKAGLEKTGKIIGPMDLLIPAQAVARNMTLVTSNTKEFERIDRLKLENWAR